VPGAPKEPEKIVWDDAYSVGVVVMDGGFNDQVQKVKRDDAF
jgi:hypothetical protein